MRSDDYIRVHERSWQMLRRDGLLGYIRNKQSEWCVCVCGGGGGGGGGGRTSGISSEECMDETRSIHNISIFA